MEIVRKNNVCTGNIQLYLARISYILNKYFPRKNKQTSYYISNKGLLDECDKEENLEVNGLLIIPI